MTWVVGATRVLGYGVVVSDIRVTLSDGTERDCLRKTYPVGKFIVAGFAGSVRIGFDLLTDLRNRLLLSEQDERTRGMCWEPALVAQGWGAEARSIFAGSPRREQELGSEILMMGVSPRLPGKPVVGAVPVVSTLRWPDFEPQIREGHGHIMSIGSGASQGRAMHHLAQIVGDRGFLDMEVRVPNSMGGIISANMAHHLLVEAPSGISPHMHVTTVGVDHFQIMNGKSRHRVPGGRMVELEMPPVAEDFQSLCAVLGLDSASVAGVRA